MELGMASCLAAAILMESIYPSIPPSLSSSLGSLSPAWLDLMSRTVHLGVTLGLAALAVRTLLLISSSNSSMDSSNPSFLSQCCAAAWQFCALLHAHPHMCSERVSLCPPREVLGGLHGQPPTLEVSMGIPSGGQLDACRGPEPSFLPQLLVLCPQVVPCCLPWWFEVCVPCSQSHPGVTGFITCAYCSRGSLPSAPQAAFNWGPNEMKGSDQARGAGGTLLTASSHWPQCHCHP